jgi:hypothetical protein
MWDSLRNLRTCEIDLKDDLGGAEREWVIKEMLLKDGVECALYHPAGSQCLIVQYDADVTTPLDMIDFLSLCGVHSESAPAPSRAARAAARAMRRNGSSRLLQRDAVG